MMLKLNSPIRARIPSFLCLHCSDSESLALLLYCHALWASIFDFSASMESSLSLNSKGCPPSLVIEVNGTTVRLYFEVLQMRRQPAMSTPEMQQVGPGLGGLEVSLRATTCIVSYPSRRLQSRGCRKQDREKRRKMPNTCVTELGQPFPRVQAF